MYNLPPKLQRDKKSLLPKYKKLKERRLKPKWYYEKKAGELCIKAGSKTVKPPTDNFDFPLEEPKAVDDGIDKNVLDDIANDTDAESIVGSAS